MALSRKGPRLKERACAACGRQFRPFNSGGKCCSLRCRDELKLQERIRDGRARCSRCKEWKPLEMFVVSSRKRSDGTPYKIPHSHCKPCNAAWFAERAEKKGNPRSRPYREAYKLDDDEKLRRKLAANQARRQKERAAGPAPKMSQIRELLRQQQGRCGYCGEDIKSGYHIDHKQPISRGGTNEIGNLHLTCGRCNLRKSAMLHEEFLVSKKRPAWRWLSACQDAYDAERLNS